MKKILFHPLFALGLLIRLALMADLAPSAVVDWYAPFLNAAVARPMRDPWSPWLAGGGSAAAFPYGYAMWSAFMPLVVLAKLLGVQIVWAYTLTLLAADVMLLLVLERMLPYRPRLLLTAYWLSPVVILATYGLGLNDLIPVLLLTLALYFTRDRRLSLGGGFCAAAISAKLSMVVALPFFLIYLYNNRSLRQRLPQFVIGLAGLGVVLLIPFVFSAGGMQMLLSNPEMGKIYALSLDLGSQTSVYLVPLVYLLMVYYAWRVRRLNFELFQGITGLAFLMIVLMTPASPGWFIWSIPFLVFYQAMSGRVAVMLASAFSGLYVFGTLLNNPLRLADGALLDVSSILRLSEETGQHTHALLLTGMVAIGLVLALRIWRETISRNDFFRLSRKPFVLGIAGDSGAGKDTYADAITGLFGGHSVVKVSGDDYHLWDRQKPMWQVMTHLNPNANDLEAFSNDLACLTDGKSIRSRHYDHQTGKMSKPRPIASNDFVIACGLHALYLPLLRACCDLKIYLDIDESLRRHFKHRRDVTERGHTPERVRAAFEKREPDSERFIRPQIRHADLVLCLQPIHPRVLDELDEARPLRLKLVVRTSHGFNELSLTRVLVGVCGLHVDIETARDDAHMTITIEGETSPEDIALGAKILCPRILEFLDIQPQWQGGTSGLMQLITLAHINQVLNRWMI
ncbi:MAG: uridine kinase [Pseudomonadota bacterium]